ncbi:glycosyltransferase family 2 protein [Candidatus Latescibacterota bacterium]
MLSVVVPAQGKENLLVRCLASLGLSLPDGGDFEVCVVDDGSGLDSERVLAAAAPRYPLIWRSFNSVKGRSAARNKGISSTSGDIIVFLDSDMEVGKGFIRAHIESHREHPRTAVIGSITWPKKGSFLRYIGSRGVAKLKPGNPLPPWYFITGNASVERKDLPSHDPFDETLPGWGGEDLDLGLKLHAAGMKFRHAPDAVAYHNFDGSLTEHIRRTELYGRDTLPVLVNRHPELKTTLKLDLLDSIAGRAAVHDLFFFPALWKVRILDSFPLPLFLYDYLTFAAYARGWLKRKCK